MRQHPCLSCGACCASYRVAFHWAETEPALGGATPAGLTEPLDPHRVVMRGTYAEPLRCTALTGTIGEAAACSIYPQRPSPCRDLGAAWEHGRPSPQCNRARLRHGLAPLRPEDWLAPAIGIEPVAPPAGPANDDDGDDAPHHAA